MCQSPGVNVFISCVYRLQNQCEIKHCHVHMVYVCVRVCVHALAGALGKALHKF